jgi:hypothetical protein
MGLTSLEVVSGRGYTVKSSEDLYTKPTMLDKTACLKHSKGKKH